MRTTTPTEFRKNLAKMMDEVVDDRTPLIIHRSGERSVVLLSIDDYNAMDETAYLRSSPANHRALMQSIEEDRRGELIHKTAEELGLDDD